MQQVGIFIENFCFQGDGLTWTYFGQGVYDCMNSMSGSWDQIDQITQSFFDNKCHQQNWRNPVLFTDIENSMW